VIFPRVLMGTLTGKREEKFTIGPFFFDPFFHSSFYPAFALIHSSYARVRHFIRNESARVFHGNFHRQPLQLAGLVRRLVDQIGSIPPDAEK